MLRWLLRMLRVLLRWLLRMLLCESILPPSQKECAKNERHFYVCRRKILSLAA
jgi:hypothetical protein